MGATVGVVIVNWNAGAQLRVCLESLAACRRDSFELSSVVVVDNASRDGSADGLEGIELPLRVIRNRQNAGFGKACNQGVAALSTDYVLFLNPDTEVGPDSIGSVARYMESPDGADVAVSGIQLFDATGEVSRCCAAFPSPRTLVGVALGLDRVAPRWFRPLLMTEFDHLSSRDVDHVIGAFYFIRRSEFLAVGGFDERFFVFFEDVDLSLRLKQAGWRCHYLVDAPSYHKGGGTSENVQGLRLFYSQVAQIRYVQKHFGRAKAVGVALAMAILGPLVRAGYAVQRRSLRRLVDTANGTLLFWRQLPALLLGPATATGVPRARAAAE